MILFYVFLLVWLFFFFKQKTAYEMRISDWSSDVCSSDLLGAAPRDRRFRGEKLSPSPPDFLGRLFDQPRAERRAKDDGDHHRAPLFDRLSRRRVPYPALGRVQLLCRDRARHAVGRVEDHRNDGRPHHQAVAPSTSEERRVGEKGVSTCC